MSTISPTGSESEPAAGSAAAPSLRISTRVDGHTTVLYLAGELDLANADVLRQQIRSALDRHDLRDLLLDLSQLDFADSTGLAAMVWAHKQLTARGGRLSLRHPNPQLTRILRVTGLHKQFPVIPPPRPPRRSDLTARAAATRVRAARDENGAAGPRIEP